MKSKEKKKFTIKDIIRLIVLLVAFSVLLYPTFSSYLNEKNSARILKEAARKRKKLRHYCQDKAKTQFKYPRFNGFD